MHILLTRPLDDSKELIFKFTSLNYKVSHLPLLKIIKKEMPEITLLSIKKIKGECNYLRFENDGFCLTFDFIRNKKSLKFMEKLDLICQNNQIIPSIIKDSRLKLNTIQMCYNGYDQFKKDLKAFDNERIYRSQLSDNLEL